MGERMTVELTEELTRKFTYAGEQTGRDPKEIIMAFLEDMTEGEMLFDRGIKVLPPIGRVVTNEECNRILYGDEAE